MINEVSQFAFVLCVVCDGYLQKQIILNFSNDLVEWSRTCYDCFDDGFTKFYLPEMLNLNYDEIQTDRKKFWISEVLKVYKIISLKIYLNLIVDKLFRTNTE